MDKFSLACVFYKEPLAPVLMKQLNEIGLPLSRLRMYIFTTKRERRTSEKLNDLRKGYKSV